MLFLSLTLSAFLLTSYLKEADAVLKKKSLFWRFPEMNHANYCLLKSKD